MNLTSLTTAWFPTSSTLTWGESKITSTCLVVSFCAEDIKYIDVQSCVSVLSWLWLRSLWSPIITLLIASEFDGSFLDWKYTISPSLPSPRPQHCPTSLPSYHTIGPSWFVKESILSTHMLRYPRSDMKQFYMPIFSVSIPYSQTTPCSGSKTLQASWRISCLLRHWRMWMLRYVYPILGEAIPFSIYISQVLKSQQRRENTVLRARIHPKIVHVIPNALIADQFVPAPRQETGDTSKLLFRRDFTLLTS